MFFLKYGKSCKLFPFLRVVLVMLWIIVSFRCFPVFQKYLSGLCMVWDAAYYALNFCLQHRIMRDRSTVTCRSHSKVLFVFDLITERFSSPFVLLKFDYNYGRSRPAISKVVYIGFQWSMTTGKGSTSAEIKRGFTIVKEGRDNQYYPDAPNELWLQLTS